MLLLFLVATVGERPMVVLEYSREGTATDCPPVARLEDAVTARLGYAPFSAGAPRRLRVVLQGDAQRRQAVVTRDGGDGIALGSKTLTSSATQCDALFDALTVTVAIAIDPLFESARTSTTPDAPTLGASSAAPSIAPRPPVVATGTRDEASATPERPDPATTQLWLRVGAAGWLTPSWSPVFALGGQRRWGSFSLGLEFSALAPVSAPLGEGNVETSSLAGSALVSWHLGPVTLGPLITAGVTRIDGRGYVRSQNTIVFRLEAGVRALAQVPLTKMLSWLIQVEGVTSLRRLVLLVSEDRVWAASLFGFVVSSGLCAHF